ncbi:MAG: DUF4430 domain-containing protein [Rubripirellula sp.]
MLNRQRDARPFRENNWLRGNRFASSPGVFVMVAMTMVMVSVGCRRSSTSVEQAPSSSVATPENASSESPTTDSVETKTGTVTMEIATKGETQKVEIDNVAAGTTLEQVMRSVKDMPVRLRGSGVTAFVDAIGDQATTGTEGWVFRVDGEFANQGVGSTKLDPPTTVTWTFGDASELLSE